MTNDPHPDWIAYAESESIRRLTLHLERVRERKHAAATGAEDAPTVIELDATADVVRLPEQERAPRVLRIHPHRLARPVGS